MVDPKTDAGCEDLLLTIQKIKPLVHVFGHIHQEYVAGAEKSYKY